VLKRRICEAASNARPLNKMATANFAQLVRNAIKVTIYQEARRRQLLNQKISQNIKKPHSLEPKNSPTSSTKVMFLSAF
jgi:hypothetical protein